MGDLLAHIKMRSFRQICQPLVLASSTHVVERPLLEVGFQFQCQANANKRIPSTLRLMLPEDKLQGLVVTEWIFDAVDFRLPVEKRRPPALKASKNRSGRR